MGDGLMLLIMRLSEIGSEKTGDEVQNLPSQGGL